MKRLFLIALSGALAILSFTACETDEKVSVIDDSKQQTPTTELTADEMRVLYQMRDKNNKIGLDEATNIANEVIAMLNAETSTRSGAGRQIAQVKAVQTPKAGKRLTRSSGDGDDIELPDTLAYIINFADSAGFTIIAGDTRVETPILCYTGTGTLGDTLTNPGIAIFLQGTESYIRRSIEESQYLRDSLMQELLVKLETQGVRDTIYISNGENTTRQNAPIDYEVGEVETYFDYGPWTILSRVGPLLPVEWHQESPFNELVRYKDCPDGTSAAGCVAVATAQIMAYWGYPSAIDGYAFDWNIIRNYTRSPNRYPGVGKYSVYGYSNETTTACNQIARLMERIGSHIGMNYQCGGGGGETNAIKATNWLRGIGYNLGYRQDFHESDVLNSLNASRPVMVRGASIKIHHTFLGICYDHEYKGGHAWVYDGYLRNQRLVTVYVTMTRQTELVQTRAFVPVPAIVTTTVSSTYYQTSPYYLHNNWGLFDNYNGYFVSGAFNAKDTDKYASDTRSNQEGNFQWETEIFPYIGR